MNGMNFEEWQALMRAQRNGGTSSEIYNYESQLGVLSQYDPEYGQTHTITYNVTGMGVPSDWPTEIKSGKTLSLSIPEGYEVVELSIDGTTLDDYKYENGVITVNNVQHDLHVELTVEQDLQDDVLIYTATEKLIETTSDKSGGVHTNAFNTTIKSHTFENGVGTIEFEEDVTTIGNYAFYNSTNLTSITIPNSVTTIGDRAFGYCSSLTIITIPDSVTSIGQYVFQSCSGLTSCTIGSSVTSIGNSAFSGCNGLTSIDLPDGVTSFGTAFTRCTGLTSIDIPDSVTSIDINAFNDCSGLTNVIIGNGATNIGSAAFNGCTSLTSIIIGSSVASIGYQAFYNCGSLTSTTSLATTPPTITAPLNIPQNCIIYVPTESVDTYKAASGWSSFANLIQAIQ